MQDHALSPSVVTEGHPTVSTPAAPAGEKTVYQLSQELKALPGAEHLPEVDHWRLDQAVSLMLVIAELSKMNELDDAGRIAAAVKGQSALINVLAEMAADPEAFKAVFVGPEGIRAAPRYLNVVGELVGKLMH